MSNITEKLISNGMTLTRVVKTVSGDKYAAHDFFSLGNVGVADSAIEVAVLDVWDRHPIDGEWDHSLMTLWKCVPRDAVSQ